MARDPRFRRVERRGSVTAGPETAHAVHVELHRLDPGREYHYRFHVDGWTSASGRAVTTPRPDAVGGALTMAFASCSNYPAGFFTAYRHLAEEQPDVVLHLGDYQYEYGAAPNPIGRGVLGPETVTLANYRQRHAQYKTDPDLQLAHAAAPWLVVWDDHEVDNNYADEIPENVGRRAHVPRAAGRGVPGLLREHAAAPLLGAAGARHAALPPGPLGPAGHLPPARHPAVPLRPGLR